MSESSPEAERIDESITGTGSSHDADIAAGGADNPDVGPDATEPDESAGAVPDSHAADVAAGFDDPSDSPTFGRADATEDGTL